MSRAFAPAEQGEPEDKAAMLDLRAWLREQHSTVSRNTHPVTPQPLLDLAAESRMQ